MGRQEWSVLPTVVAVHEMAVYDCGKKEKLNPIILIDILYNSSPWA